MAKVLLAGLDGVTAAEFSHRLYQLGFDVDSQPCSVLFPVPADADVVFASGDDIRSLRALKRLRAEGSARPFILVSRVAGEEQWIAALEAGATDYCPAGIDVGNLSWIMENALHHKALTFAA